MPSFKVPCPSCEAQVLIKNPNLVGTKVECPKCKYRFKVPEPTETPAADDGGKKPTKDAADGKKAKKKGPSPKVLVGIGLGVVGVILLGGGAMTLFGDDKDKHKGGGGGGAYVPPAPAPEPEPEPKPKPKNTNRGPSIPASDVKLTNLLHPDSEAILRLDMERVQSSALASQLFEPSMVKLFRSSMGFDPSEVSSYFHCSVGSNRLPFGVMRMRSVRSPKETIEKMMLGRSEQTVKTRELFKVDSNPFITAMAQTFTLRSLFADFIKPMPQPATLPEKPYGICVYDTQTILIGDYELMEQYLDGLNEEGYPKFRQATGGSADVTLVATYQTINDDLRKAVVSMEGIEGRPIALWVEKYNQKTYDPNLLRLEYTPIAAAAKPVTSRIQYLGVRLTDFDKDKLHGTVRLFLAEGDVDNVTNALSPKLAFATPIISTVLAPGKDEAPITFRDLTKGETGIEPIGPGPGPGPGPGSSSSGPGPGRPMGPGSPPSPPPMGPTRPPGPGVMPGPGRPSGPGVEGQPGPGGYPDSSLASDSHIDLDSNSNGTVTITVDIKWKTETFNQVVYPWIYRETASVKGKLEVNSGLATVHALRTIPAQAKTKEFPLGTVDRASDGRLPLPGGATPDTRLSFFVDLLPYMGRDPRLGDRNVAWFHPKNLEAAETWVPELLVPYYPGSSWRVNSPFAPGRSVGGTNYVGIAGIGVNAARYNPANKEEAKLMGMTGYDWKSTPEDVKDGLSNTIYLMQAKPGLGRPWIAGGGSTLVGINDKTGHPMDDFSYKHPGQSKPGSFALMGDGSVRYIPADIKKEVFYGMVTRAGGSGETIPGEDAPLIPAPGMPDSKKD